jgi:hypothetical protein
MEKGRKGRQLQQTELEFWHGWWTGAEWSIARVHRFLSTTRCYVAGTGTFVPSRSVRKFDRRTRPVTRRLLTRSRRK